MEILLLGIYSFFVWLIFIKLKLLPWTTPWKVARRDFPGGRIAAMLLLLNIFAPTTTDVRVVKYVVPVVSQVRGRVIEVPVENNRPVKKGDVLFKIDPTPYQNEVHSLEARLPRRRRKVGAERTRSSARSQAKLADADSSERQLSEQLKQATGQVGVAAGVARTRAEARRAEHRAGRRRRRQPLRSRAGADQRQRARPRRSPPRAPRSRKCARSSRGASAATSRPSPRSRRRSRRRRRR